MAEQGLQFQTCISAEGELTLSLVNADFPDPKDDEVLVRVEAAPINPSDLGLLFGPADMASATYGEVDGLPTVTARCLGFCSRATRTTNPAIIFLIPTAGNASG